MVKNPGLLIVTIPVVRTLKSTWHSMIGTGQTAKTALKGGHEITEASCER